LSVIYLFNDPLTIVIYTLSLHDALPIFYIILKKFHLVGILKILLIILIVWQLRLEHALFLLVFLIYYIYYGLKLNKIFLWISIIDRKSTRLNSSHVKISYAVFCLKKKNT